MISKIKNLGNKKIFLLFAIFLILSLGTAILISRKVYTQLFVTPVIGAVLHTSMGDIEIKFRNDAPVTVENFIKLTNQGLYEKTRFHRVVPNFLIEAGDPLTKFDSTKNEWGNGGPGYVFPDEIHQDDTVKKGIVAMVNSGPDTNGSQFFIMVAEGPWLDQQHSIFADVINGMDVAENIASAPVGVTSIPVEDIWIQSIEIK